MKLAIIVNVPDDQPIKSTLGRALKALLRRYQLRCIDIRDVPTPLPIPPPTASEPSNRRQLPRELGRGEDEPQTRQDAPRPPELAPIGAPEASEGIGMTQTPSEGVKCGRSDAGGLAGDEHAREIEHITE